MIIPITGRENKTIKFVRSLARKKERIKNEMYFAEGVRLVQEAIRDAEGAVQYLLVSSSYAEKNEIFLNSLDEMGKTVYTANDTIFQTICQTENPQGIGAVIKMPKQQKHFGEADQFVLVIDGVSDPGNLGTMIRTAEAAGVDKVCILKGSADIYNPKTVRATMGSIFRMRFWIDDAECIFSELREKGFMTYAAALQASIPVQQAVVSQKRALVIGSEAFGVSETVLQMADVCVRLDMKGKVESLNAAVAAGILLYQFEEYQ